MLAMGRDELVTGDCVDIMTRLPAESVDLVFADPPFNIGYEYDVYHDQRHKDDYLTWAEKWLSAAVRLLKPTGSFFLAIGDEFVAEHKVRLDALGLELRNWIIWHYTFGVNCTKKFNRSHAHVLYYTKHSTDFTFNADEIRVPSARQTTYADRRANPVGKLPDDTWVLRPQETDRHFQPDSDTWFASRVCGTFKERTGHPCQMPEAVLERIIRVASNPGDLVFDPFGGSGTTLVVAKKLGRHFSGVELSESYAEGIRERLDGVRFGEGLVKREPVSVPRRPGVKRSRAAGLHPQQPLLWKDE
jgi:site-specific DNA-methyltransferase (adenine-specific)